MKADMTHATTAPRLPIWTPRHPRLSAQVTPWHPVWRLLGAAVWLAARGCKVRSIALKPAPRIVIDPPPPGLLASYAYARRMGQPLTQRHYIAHHHGIAITWTQPIEARP